MNTILNAVKNVTSEIESATKKLVKASTYLQLIPSDLHHSTNLCIYQMSLDFYVTNREDLEKLFALAPRGKFWKKTVSGDTMIYTCVVSDSENTWADDYYAFVINVRGEGLPPTCNVIEEEVEVPAKPAYTYKRSVVKCDVPQRAEGGAIITGEESGVGQV